MFCPIKIGVSWVVTSILISSKMGESWFPMLMLMCSSPKAVMLPLIPFIWTSEWVMNSIAVVYVHNMQCHVRSCCPFLHLDQQFLSFAGNANCCIVAVHCLDEVRVYVWVLVFDFLAHQHCAHNWENHIGSQVDLVVLLIFIFYVDSGLSNGVFESASEVRKLFPPL